MKGYRKSKRNKDRAERLRGRKERQRMTLQEFIQEVKALGLKWEVTDLEMIRTLTAGYPVCPIIALARAKGLRRTDGSDYANYEYDMVAPDLGLSSDNADAIVRSADRDSRFYRGYPYDQYDQAVVSCVRPMLLDALMPERGEA